jgi:transketolase
LRGTPVPVIPIGIDDRFGQSAHGYDELLAEYGLTTENIFTSVKKLAGR